MNVFAIFAAFAAGIVLDATYQHVRKENEFLAYQDGYKQAQKEEAMLRQMASVTLQDLLDDMDRQTEHVPGGAAHD